MVVTSTLVFSQSNDEKSVRHLLDQMAAALKSNNADATAKFYADDYTWVTPDGHVYNKTQRLESIRSGQSKVETAEYVDPKIRIYGNTAVVNAAAKIKLIGQDEFTALVILVFVKKGDTWQVVATQGTLPAK